MANLISSLAIIAVIVARHLASAAFKCSTDQECEAKLNLLQCSNGICVCRPEYTQTETKTSDYYEIQCLDVYVIKIAGPLVVMIVLGLSVCACLVGCYIISTKIVCFE